MSSFNEDLFFLIASPIYAIIIFSEIIFSNIYHKGWYSTKGTFENLWIMTSALLLDILMRFVGLFVMNYFFEFRLIEIENVILYWVLLILFEDFVFWFLHWVDHYVRFFWAVHITHHNSEEYNLTVGLRSSVLEPLYRFLYFIPIVLLGFQPIDILVVFSITQWYGILVHTQAVPKLGPLEWILVTPSHHRVHHGYNTQYLDKNMGMFLIIWDKIFGTFEKESETVKYGITQNIHSHHPRKVVFHEFANIVHDVKNAPGFYNKWMYVFGPPGWSHDGSKKTSKQLRNEQLKTK
jgi:sterol desaturase/sphingolipid hydroxylase (fatty acid hydroxylase superfamily)